MQFNHLVDTATCRSEQTWTSDYRLLNAKKQKHLPKNVSIWQSLTLQQKHLETFTVLESIVLKDQISTAALLNPAGSNAHTFSYSLHGAWSSLVVRLQWHASKNQGDLSVVFSCFFLLFHATRSQRQQHVCSRLWQFIGFFGDNPLRAKW